MEQILSFLSLGWLGTLVGVVGLIVSWWLYKKSVRHAAPAVHVDETELVGSGYRSLPESVTILFNSKPVPRVVKSVVRFWNDGNLTLRGDDMASAEPLAFSVTNGEILTARVIKATRTAIKANVAIDQNNRNQARISFEFMDEMDGVLVEFLHTGEPWQYRVLGVFKGSPPVQESRFSHVYFTAWRRAERYRLVVILSALLVSLSLLTSWGETAFATIAAAYPSRIDLDTIRGLILATALTLYLTSSFMRSSKPVYPRVLADEKIERNG